MNRTRVWQPIATAPHDGTIVKIKGIRFRTERGYFATAVWTKRRCPKVEVEGWFPPGDKHDGQGPYDDVTHWQPMKREAAA